MVNTFCFLDYSNFICLFKKASKFKTLKKGFILFVHNFFSFFNYFIEGKDIGNLDTIIEIVKQTNLYEDGIEQYLLSKKDNANLLNEAQQANAIGISGVPCFIFNKEFVINGAQPSDVFKNIINSLIKK